MQREVLEKYVEVLEDLEFLIREQKFPFLRKEGERSLENFHFSWIELGTEISKPKSKKVLPIGKGKNASCQLCPNRQIPIKNFFHKGNVPILILHYTGAFRKNQQTLPPKSEKSILRTVEAEDILNRLLYKVFSKTLPNFYFQEYPACMFNQNTSEDVDWKNRIENCWTFVEDTIREHQIQGIILTGAAAVLKYGMEKAKELTGVIQEISVSSKKIPLVVLRSPDALLSLEQKRKQYEKNKNSPEYQKAREEEQKIKQSTINYMFAFKERVGL